MEVQITSRAFTLTKTDTDNKVANAVSDMVLMQCEHFQLIWSNGFVSPLVLQGGTVSSR